MRRPVVLIVRDGWGRNPDPKWNHANAVHLARKPVGDDLLRRFPSTLIRTSGFDVGLPEGTMGNSEVGHQNLGAGRIVDQESVRITKAIRSGEFFDNPTLAEVVDAAARRGAALHLLGIVSDAGVHGLLEHLYACLELAKRRGLSRVFLHAFTDGRDTPPHSGIGYIGQIEQKMQALGVGRVATVGGRYYAMDRDNRWDRVEKAYRALVDGDGPTFASAAAAIEHYYAHPSDPSMNGDEFITPSILADDGRAPRAVIRDGDSVLFYNYRGDRPRELTRAFTVDAFDGFPRAKKLDVAFATLTAYEQGLPVRVAYPKPPKMTGILGELLAARGLTQFRCAETEKFPHVTFFFNDYREEPFPGEQRVVVPSRRDVPTYDQVPEMSAPGIADAAARALDSGQFDLLVVNFANGDMVGHTGVLSAAVQAVEAVDRGCGVILEALRRAGGAAIVTADHGNCEQMIDPETGGPHTAHTTFDVDLVLADERFAGRRLRDGGRLADVAPTLLEMLGIDAPAPMTGRSLLQT